MAAQASNADKTIIVGKVSGVYGVKGWVKLFSWTQPKENIADYNPLLLEVKPGQWEAKAVRSAKPHGRTIVAQFEEIDDRNQAEAWVGKRLAINPDQLPDLEEGWYWSELIGLTVISENGQEFGVVSEMQETGANDVLVVGKGADAVLIPFVTGPIVKQVDLDAGTILVDWDAEYL